MRFSRAGAGVPSVQFVQANVRITACGKVAAGVVLVNNNHRLPDARPSCDTTGSLLADELSDLLFEGLLDFSLAPAAVITGKGKDNPGNNESR